MTSFNKKELEKMSGIYNLIIQLEPENPILYYNRGIILTQLDLMSEAIDCFNKALNLDPNNPKILVNKGICLLELNEEEKAHHLFEKALRVDPENSLAKKYFGNKYQIVRKKKEDSTRKLQNGIKRSSIIKSRRLDVNALRYWGLKLNPFFIYPLTFKNIEKDSLLTKTHAIKQIDDIFIQSENTESDRIILLTGHRGIGKTTAMNYLDWKISKSYFDKKILGIICNVYLSEDPENITKIHNDVTRSILESFKKVISSIDILNEIDLQRANSLLYNRNVRGREMDIEIRTLIQEISQFFERIFIFIDNLDKISPQSWTYLMDYFNNYQIFYENLISNREKSQSYITLVIALQESIGNYLANQLNGYIDIVLNIPSWTFDDIIDMFIKRIRYASTKIETKLDINNFITKSSLRYIYDINGGNPQFCLHAFKNILQLGATERVKPITLNFCKNYKEAIGVILDTELDKNIKYIDELLRKEFPETFSKLLKVMTRYEKDDIPDLIIELASVQSKDSFKASPNLKPLEKYGLIKKTNKESIYEVPSEVKAMIESIIDFLDGNISKIPLIIEKR